MNGLNRRAYRFSPARIVSVFVLMCLAACSGGSTTTTSPSAVVPGIAASTVGNSTATARESLGNVRPANTPLLPPPGTIYFGAFVNYQKTLGPYEAQTAAFEQQIGRTLGIHAEYYAWTDNFPGAPEEDDFAHGRAPVISWDCGVSNYQVASGAQDALITQRAQAFKAYKHLVFLRFFWEMNLPYDETNRAQCYDSAHDNGNGVFSPTEYVAAWDHIRAIFAAQKVTNVVWLWNPSGTLTISPTPYYPGTSETDWVGFDHYDVTGSAGLQNTLAAPYAALQQIDSTKPIMVGETGTAPKSQSTYLGTAPSVMQTNFPAILGLIYFDAYGHRQDWRLTTAGIAAYKSAGATTYFSAMVKKKTKN